MESENGSVNGNSGRVEGIALEKENVRLDNPDGDARAVPSSASPDTITLRQLFKVSNPFSKNGYDQPQGVSEPALAGSPNPIGSEANKIQQAILDKLESLKIPTHGTLHAFGLVPAAWKALIDGVKLAVKGGMALQAAENGSLNGNVIFYLAHFRF